MSSAVIAARSGGGLVEVSPSAPEFLRGDAFGELGERLGLGGEEIPGEALVAVGLGDLAVESAEVRERLRDRRGCFGRKRAQHGVAGASASVGLPVQAWVRPATIAGQFVGHGWWLPLSPQLVSRMPRAPCASAAEIASR